MWTIAISEDNGPLIINENYRNISLPKDMMLESANMLNREMIRWNYKPRFVAVPVPMHS